MSAPLLRRLAPADVVLARAPVDEETLAIARDIVEGVRDGGRPALERYVRDLDGGGDATLVSDAAALERARDALEPETRALLERTRERIARFAAAQRASLSKCELAIPGGAAGHVVAPVATAGCYAPGGRFPLPSSVLMTVATARAARVETVWLATPRPSPLMLGAAAVAGADAVLGAGGAHAIAALAHGVVAPACDVVVGPGNRFVTAAKQIVSGVTRIDMLAGPSELLVVADAAADPDVIAADLLAQAEHDVDARPLLVALDERVVAETERALRDQLQDLPTRATAEAALGNGFAVVARDRDEAIALVDRIAPEHLALLLADPEAFAARVDHAGAIFLGARSAEVFGDYGAGPNHTLPTGGAARAKGGLSVYDFLRIRTWLRLDDPSADGLITDAASLARLEGLEAHARSAELRRS